MDIEKTLNNIVFLSLNRERKNRSNYTLLQESGYFQNHDQITEETICETLQKHPECIESWFIFSEDKRTSGGWAFFRQKKKFIVRSLSENQMFEYDDVYEACASFIKKEMETIRNI